MSRSKIEELSRRFAELHSQLCDLARDSRAEELFRSTRKPDSLRPSSAAAVLVRSAAAVEQMINGVTVRLWDDPFEWTLPEHLANTADLVAYFNEVEDARVLGFGFLRSDSDLERTVPAPVELKTLEQLLIETIDRSQAYLSEAVLLLARLKDRS